MCGMELRPRPDDHEGICERSHGATAGRTPTEQSRDVRMRWHHRICALARISVHSKFERGSPVTKAPAETLWGCQACLNQKWRGAMFGAPVFSDSAAHGSSQLPALRRAVNGRHPRTVPVSRVAESSNAASALARPIICRLRGVATIIALESPREMNEPNPPPIAGLKLREKYS